MRIPCRCWTRARSSAMIVSSLEEFTMRWDDFRRSDNVEDSRGESGGFGGGGMGIPVGGGGLGIGTIVVLGHTEDTWTEIFKNGGQQYRVPRLRLYSGAIQGGCGFAQSAMGPFYCPNDRRIYLDTSFFRDMQVRFRGCSGKACEFAEAYVIAHEVGHHVQNLLGILPKAQSAQRDVGSRAEANRIQVRVELQADCLAGVWAHHSNQRWNSLEPGDVEAALQTAAAIGDDRLQQQSRGYVVPDAFTHGSSAQRQRWFTIGLKDGKVSSCNTFSATAL